MDGWGANRRFKDVTPGGIPMSTAAITITRPQPGEYDPYYERYISLVQSDDVVAALEQQFPETAALLGSRGATRA